VNATLAPAVAAALDAHLARWRGRLLISPRGAFDERSSILKLPGLVAEAYPSFDGTKLGEIVVALSLFSDGIVAYDDIIDYAKTMPNEARRLPHIAVLFSQAYRTFAELYGGAPGFWNALESYFIDYVDALNAEAAFAAGTRSWESASEAECLAIATGKNGLVRLVDASVAALAPPYASRGTDIILLALFVANQMVDDLRDWREDVRDANVSLLLRRVCPVKPSTADVAEVGRRIYLGGHAQHVLGIAEEHLRRAHAVASSLGARGFVAVAEERLARMQGLRARVDREIESLRSGAA